MIAARVFAAKGIASATVRDVAHEAGILPGSLYHHFTSKEELVREVLAPGGADALDFRAIFDSASNADEALQRSMRLAVTWVAGNPEVARIFRNDAHYISETPALAENEAWRQSNRLIWIEIIEAGIAESRFRDDLNADLTVRVMWDAVLGSTRWFAPFGDADPGEIADHLADLFLAGIRTPEVFTHARERQR